jgi:hypothetical protein
MRQLLQLPEGLRQQRQPKAFDNQLLKPAAAADAAADGV